MLCSLNLTLGLTAAPSAKNLTEYLRSHPNCEVYTGQDSKQPTSARIDPKPDPTVPAEDSTLPLKKSRAIKIYDSPTVQSKAHESPSGLPPRPKPSVHSSIRPGAVPKRKSCFKCSQSPATLKYGSQRSFLSCSRPSCNKTWCSVCLPRQKEYCSAKCTREASEEQDPDLIAVQVQSLIQAEINSHSACCSPNLLQ